MATNYNLDNMSEINYVKNGNTTSLTKVVYKKNGVSTTVWRKTYAFTINISEYVASVRYSTSDGEYGIINQNTTINVTAGENITVTVESHTTPTEPYNFTDSGVGTFSSAGSTTVSAIRTVKSFVLTITKLGDQTDKMSCNARRVSSPYAGAEIGTLYNGATIYYGDILNPNVSGSTWGDATPTVSYGPQITSLNNSQVTVSNRNSIAIDVYLNDSLYSSIPANSTVNYSITVNSVQTFKFGKTFTRYTSHPTHDWSGQQTVSSNLTLTATCNASDNTSYTETVYHNNKAKYKLNTGSFSSVSNSGFNSIVSCSEALANSTVRYHVYLYNGTAYQDRFSLSNDGSSENLQSRAYVNSKANGSWDSSWTISSAGTPTVYIRRHNLFGNNNQCSGNCWVGWYH